MDPFIQLAPLYYRQRHVGSTFHRVTLVFIGTLFEGILDVSLA